MTIGPACAETSELLDRRRVAQQEALHADAVEVDAPLGVVGLAGTPDDRAEAERVVADPVAGLQRRHRLAPLRRPEREPAARLHLARHRRLSRLGTRGGLRT